MGYAILRTQKLKDKGSISRSLKHSFRAQDTPNADPEKTPDNTHIGAETIEDAMNGISERLATQPKIRKNAVLAVEYLVTGSPEILNKKSRAEQDSYFSDALDWMRKKHGEENVVYAGIHRDETTPHLYAYVVPIDDQGRLNCRAFLGGSKALNEMQTDFAENVAKKYDLERGIEGSKAKHKTIQKYYAEIQKESHQIKTEDLPKRYKKLGGLIFETDESYAETVAEFVLEKVRPELEKAKMYESAEQAYKEHNAARRQLGNDANGYRKLMKDLPFSQELALQKQADTFRAENEQKKQQAIEQEKELKRLEREQARQRNRRRGHGRGDGGLGL